MQFQSLFECPIVYRSFSISYCAIRIHFNFRDCVFPVSKTARLESWTLGVINRYTLYSSTFSISVCIKIVKSKQFGQSKLLSVWQASSLSFN